MKKKRSAGTTTVFSRPLACPYCGESLTAATSIEEGTSFQDKSIIRICVCLICAQPSICDVDKGRPSRMRQITEDEYCELPAMVMQLILRVQDGIRFVDAAGKRARRRGG